MKRRGDFWAQLVRRGPRGVTLTEAGRLLYERAGTILELTRAAQREVSGLGKGLAGTVCMAVAHSAWGLAPAGRLTGLASGHPDVSLELRAVPTSRAIELVGSGAAEVGVVRTPFPSQGLRCRYAPHEPLVAVMPAALEVGGELSVTSDALAQAPLACDGRVLAALGPLLAGRGLAPRVACRTSEALATCAAAASGLGVGLVPQSVLRVCDTGRCFIKTVAERDLETRAAVVWKAGRTLTPLAEHVIGLLGDLS